VRRVGIGLVIFSVWFSILLFAQDEKPLRILSIDGGGVRVILYDLEVQLKKPISQIFDIVTGSSVGGIIALGLTTPNSRNQPLHSALDLVDFFIDHRKNIFKRSLSHSIKTLGGLIGPQYESDGFQAILDKMFGDNMLSQALIPTLVTGYHIDGNAGIEFFSPDAKNFPHDMDCLARLPMVVYIK
jgi:patatin-like phospholipase/acyl hydrolase